MNFIYVDWADKWIATENGNTFLQGDGSMDIYTWAFETEQEAIDAQI